MPALSRPTTDLERVRNATFRHQQARIRCPQQYGVHKPLSLLERRMLAVTGVWEHTTATTPTADEWVRRYAAARKHLYTNRKRRNQAT